MADQAHTGLTQLRQNQFRNAKSKLPHIDRKLGTLRPGIGRLSSVHRCSRSRTVSPEPIPCQQMPPHDRQLDACERLHPFVISKTAVGDKTQQKATRISSSFKIQKPGYDKLSRPVDPKTYSQVTSLGESAIDRLGQRVTRSLEISDEDENPDKASQRYQNALGKLKKHKEQVDTAIIPEDVDEETTSQDEGEVLNSKTLFSAIPISLDDDDDDLEITRVVRRKSKVEITQFKGTTSRGVKYTCARGKCVELENGEFVRILSVTADQNEGPWIIGHLFIRHNDLGDSKWPRRHNEVVLMSTLKEDRPQLTVKRSTKKILRNRKLILTNQSYPLMSSKDHPDSFKAVHVDKEVGPLFCRWKHIHVLDSTNQFTVEESIERLSFNMADPEARVEDTQVRFEWRRQPTALGGEHKYDQVYVEDDGHSYKQLRQYTMVDTFCGGGGASCAAVLAGLCLVAGIDSNEKAMQTYKANYASKGTRCYLEDIHDFITRYGNRKQFSDVLHISPPCQPWSPAHTVLNMLMDELNEAAMFAVGELLRVLKPRTVTLEETFGLKNRHEAWFNALIKMFLDKGYSIRWKIAKLEEYGLPQKRRRLLMIAAGPGETLPPFPAITHSENNPTLKRLSTIQDAIGDIPRRSSVTHHDIRAAIYHPSQQKLPYSPHTQAKTITTSGGIGNHHPSGLRTFTIREFAALQMFPLTYKFADVGVTAQRRQIGNAVPPYIFKKIYREIIQSLKKTDGVL